MAQIGFSEASRLSGRSRSTLYRAVKSGVLSATTDSKGNQVIDVAELARVYGPLRNETQDTVSTHESSDTHEAIDTAHRVKILEEQVKARDEQIKILKDQVDDLRKRLDKSDERVDVFITQKKLTWFGSLFRR